MTEGMEGGSCSCMDGDYEAVDGLERWSERAAENIRCDECCSEIMIGQVYEKSTWVYDGTGEKQNRCVP